MSLPPRPLHRLFKASLFSGALMSLPLWLCVAWYAWSAYAEGDRHLRAAAPGRALDAELFQIYLHDTLVSDLRRLTLPPPPERGLPTLSLALSRSALDELLDGPLKEGEEAYVKALVEKDGAVSEARVRRRGGQFWHWLRPQKSLKVRLDKGELIDGTRVFNLVNDVTPFGLEDQLILDVAREWGLLTPEYRPVRVRLNGAEMGVYRFEAHPDEGLLRRSRRLVGDVISGDTDAMVDGVGAVFMTPEAWQKVDARQAAATGDDASLEGAELVAAVRGASHGEFKRFAERRLDLPRYARFDALDVVFGGSDHDYFSNHKFYLDPARGVLEPVAHSFRGFQHEPVLNLVDHPLLYRLKFLPDYLVDRNRAVYELLTGPASVPEIRSRTWAAFEALAPDLRADPYWDAYKLLPRVSRLHRFMVRPMTMRRWELSAHAELRTFASRSRFLLGRLEALELGATLQRQGEGAGTLTVRVDGEVAHKLLELRLSQRCPGRVGLYADLDLDGRRGAGDPLIATAQDGVPLRPSALEVLQPGLVAVARPGADAKKGAVWLQPEGRLYTYFLDRPECAAGATLVVQNLASLTSATVEAREGPPPTPPAPLPATGAVASLREGERSPHRWAFGAPPPRATVALGPGRVEFVRTRVFSDLEEVKVAPGTTLLLGEGASLVFRGRLQMEGTRDAPIRVQPLDPARPFGGLALAGPAASGSVLAHVALEGGGRPLEEDGPFTGNLTVLEAADVSLSSVRIAPRASAGEALHAVYAQRLRLAEVEIDRAPVDGLDLEYSSAEVRGLRVRGAGDDCVDLMGSTVQLSSSALWACANNGISAGELSRLSAHTLLVANADVGVLAKNDSQVRLTAAVLYGADTALETRRQPLYYARGSSIGADLVYVVGCDKVSDAKKGTSIEVGALDGALPDDARFDPLLGLASLSSWAQLPELPQAVARP